jgi:transcriptional regulator with XRE-family HTH domain
MNSENKIQFSQRLRQLIHTLKIRDKDFAAAAQVTKQTLSAYLKGTREPSLSKLANWVLAYNVNGTWLLTGQGEMFLSDPNQTLPTIEPSPDATPTEREMRTFVALMKENADSPDIRKGLMAKLGVKISDEKELDGYGLRERRSSRTGVHEPSDNFGKDI